MAAAWEASLAGRSVWVLEREPSLGGLCATVERDGFHFDLGGHRIVSKRAALVDRLRALMGDGLEERTRRSVIHLRGQRFSYPLVASELLAHLPWPLLARATIDYAAERGRVALGAVPTRDETFRAWVTRRFGRTLYELFFGPYTEKLWGLSADALSADWASQRISLLNLADVGLRLAGIRRGGARTYARRYLYPTCGIGALFARLADMLTARGVRFLTEAQAQTFERDNDSGRIRSVTVAARGSAPLRVECGGVISTIPLASAAALVHPHGPSVAEHARRLGHRGLRFLNVMLDGPGPILDATWMYVPDPSLVMTRVQEPAERSPSMTPPGRASLMIEVPADPGSPLDRVTDQDLAARALSDLTALGIDVRARVRGVFSTRAPHAYPTYALGYDRHRDALLAIVAQAPNLWTVGRQGLFRYVFMDTAMEMGFAAARAFVRGDRADHREIFAIDNNPTLHEVQSVLG